MKTIMLEQRPVTVSNIYCVATNYAAHAVEMNSSVSEAPLFFMKPTTAMVLPGEPIVMPNWSQNVHHEVEVVIAIGKDGVNVPRNEALSYVTGYGIGLDVTARDIQSELKQAGRPWTLSKGFHGSAVLSDFVCADKVVDPDNIDFSLEINGEVRQVGNTSRLVFGITEIIEYLSQHFGLQAGDLIYTGTPEGVGPLQHGDRVVAKLADLITDVRQVA